MNLHSFVRGVDLDAVREATREAERLTGTELVCLIVGRCDDYPEASWRGAALGALAAVTIDALSAAFGEAWGAPPASWRIAVVLLGLVLGWMAVTWTPGLMRLLVDREVMQARVARRAAQAFLEEEVVSTVDRTGVLLMVAVFEHRVEILVDEGVAVRVEEAVWEGVIADLEARLPGPDRGAALVQAVNQLGTILAEHGVPRREADVDELPDQPRLRDR